ncbi:hypothetical protein SMD44_p10050 (plasmid) [Streptomyces alboflavus]|uniref:Uncharacterized protein n=1 Tax=Streptomyces alboflavus TaxID=67267 RepID=A0A291W4P1_9ACTN|nr:hypothetical protein [Streptomyces alboflavus]ATM24549.1 hypothetical protein SMD44_p10050 [Streptomyces alboflavus]
MSILLIGNWDGPLLTIEASHRVRDGDQAAIGAHLSGHSPHAWAREYLVDRHSTAVQCAYDELPPSETCSTTPRASSPRADHPGQGYRSTVPRRAPARSLRPSRSGPPP